MLDTTWPRLLHPSPRWLHPCTAIAARTTTHGQTPDAAAHPARACVASDWLRPGAQPDAAGGTFPGPVHNVLPGTRCRLVDNSTQPSACRWASKAFAAGTGNAQPAGECCRGLRARGGPLRAAAYSCRYLSAH